MIAVSEPVYALVLALALVGTWAVVGAAFDVLASWLHHLRYRRARHAAGHPTAAGKHRK